MSRKKIMTSHERSNAIKELTSFCLKYKGQQKAKALLDFLEFEEAKENNECEDKIFASDNTNISLATAYRYLSEYKEHGIKGIQDDKQIIIEYLQYHPMYLAENGTIVAAWTRNNLASFINKKDSAISKKLYKHPITEHTARICLAEFVSRYYNEVQIKMPYDTLIHIAWERIEKSENWFGIAKYQIRYCVNNWECEGKDKITVKECWNQKITAHQRDKITNRNLAGAVLGEICRIRERHKIEENVIIYLPDGNVCCEVVEIIKTCQTFYLEVGKNKEDDRKVLKDLKEKLTSSNKEQQVESL